MTTMGKATTMLSMVFLGALYASAVLASDPDLTTDFGINSTSAADFTFTGFRNIPPNPEGKAAPTFAAFNAGKPSPFVGLTGLGLTAVQFDFGPHSQINPHTHPRATELFYVIEGTIDVGFVDTANTLFATTVKTGDLFVFPKGTLHFQRNNQDATATGYSVLSSENPGVLLVGNALFTASNTGLPDLVLSTALGTNVHTITSIKKTLESQIKAASS